MSEKASGNTGEEKRNDYTINRRNYLKMTSAAGASLGAGLGATALGSEVTTPARAATTVVDKFNDTDLDGRYVFDSRGATTEVTDVSSEVTSGADTNVLQMSGDGTTRMHAYKGDSDSDLKAYPENGDTLSCWMRGLNGTENMNFVYGAQDKDNKYYVKLNLATGVVGLYKYVNGSGQSFAGDWSNSTVQNNTDWFKVEIDWATDHTHTVTVYQNESPVTTFSEPDDSGDPHTGTGVGYSAYLSSGETAQFDYATTSGTTDSGGSTNTGSSVSVDNFESGGLDSYKVDNGQKGDPGGFLSTSDSDRTRGNYGLVIKEEDTELRSPLDSGLQNYPSAGDTFGGWVKASPGSYNTNLSYGVQDAENRYYAKFDYNNDSVYLFKLKNGSGTVLEHAANLGLSAETWYYLEVDWKSDSAGTQQVSLYDNQRQEITSFSGDDDEWSQGGFGIDGYVQTGEKICWDEISLSHQTELVIKETAGKVVNYQVQFNKQDVSGAMLETENDQDQIVTNDDGTATVIGKLSGNDEDRIIYDYDTLIKSIRVQGKGNVEMEADGNLVDPSNNADRIEIHGVDVGNDGTSPSMPYSFRVFGSIGGTNNLEDGEGTRDESPETLYSDVGYGDVSPGDSDVFRGVDGKLMRFHADVRQGDRVELVRTLN